ncbi:MAG: hypothetical protein A3G20_06755 [Acidobacteria bacterium RIFCSPLOWO2_12_FULL_59_11]|nr:MAG: hypothetical protein A3G20_06755 [Acidobacteria bacterium RIFCSPLOWO2_12_FULL_59_11]
MPDTLEVRIAHLEGAYEQIDKRLSGVEMGLVDLRREMGTNFSQVHQEISQLRKEAREQFRWILGFQIVTWISILGTLLAILFRQ